jgi:hypothetical protein
VSNNLSISIQGGVAALGNIVQGNGNHTNATISVSAVDQKLQAAHSAISDLGRELRLPNNQIEEVVKHLRELASESKATTPEPEKGAGILKAIRDNSSWAYPIVKDFLSVAWPAVLSLVA